MKNYYETLEVNENASQEIINKVYKILAKKYHPDLQQKDPEKSFEKKFKEISEAYETLSNEEKRKVYDIRLQEFKISQLPNTVDLADFQQLQSYCTHLENRLSVYEKKGSYFNKIQNQAYKNAYINSAKKFGYKVKEKRTFKDSFKSFMVWTLSILVISLLAYIIWNVPFLRERILSPILAPINIYL